MIYGFIITAGNQTRFKNNKPKALVDINGISCLDLNIQNLGEVCDTVVVVCSHENEEYFKDYFRIVIDSGYGCGDAILKTLLSFDFNSNDTCFIQWGDCFINDSEFYKKIKNKYNIYNSDVIVPCNYEYNPYVKLDQFSDYEVEVKFSKFNEVDNEYGFHDMCVFYGDVEVLKYYCYNFAIKFYDHDKRNYIHKHGNEFNFLDLFNDTNIRCKILDIKNKYKCYSFNTEDEYKQILEEIKN